MIPLIAQLSGMAETGVWLVSLVFFRVGAAMALLPAFGEQSVPQRIRLVLALLFTVIVAPAVLPEVEVAVRGVSPWAVVAGEIAVGLALGFTLRLFVFALQIAGTIAAQSASLSQLFGGVSVDPLPTIGQIMVVSGLALAVATGLHVRVAEALIETYRLFPPGQLPGAEVFADWGVARIGAAFALAFSLAMPFVIGALVYNLALGVINRAMPQLMVTLIGAPALTAGILLMMVAAMPILLAAWQGALEQTLAAPDLGLP